jgi:hypothetical protein
MLNPSIDQDPAELIQQQVIHYVLRATDLILFAMRKKCHSSGRNLFLYLFITGVIKSSSHYKGIPLLPTFYPIYLSQGYSTQW